MSVRQYTIVVSVDWLRAAYLGCYGNTWVATPAIDRLAAESIVFDEAHAAGPDLGDFFRAAWQSPLQECIQRARTKLLTDDPEVARWGAAAGFEDVTTLPAGEAIAPARELEETHLAAVCAAAAEQLDALNAESGILWLHLGSLGQTWDAPRALRERYHEDDDAPLPEFVAPPCKLPNENFDPDERWAYALAYAAQVSTLDACLGVLFEPLRAAAWWRHATFLLCGTRGFPLGEHRRVGPIDQSLYGELLHVPWILRAPGDRGAMERRRELVVPPDLPLLLTGTDVTGHEQLRFQGQNGETALRTRDWFLRQTNCDNQTRNELYAKPDDRWEVNDVRGRCVDIVDELLNDK